MNETLNKFLLAGDQFMPEIYLSQPGFNYSAFGPFTKNKELIQEFKETGNLRYFYRNELDKVCFQHEIAFNIVKTLKYDGDQRALASVVYIFLDKKSLGSGFRSVIMPHQELAKELQKPFQIRKFEKRKV